MPAVPPGRFWLAEPWRTLFGDWQPLLQTVRRRRRRAVLPLHVAHWLRRACDGRRVLRSASSRRANPRGFAVSICETYPLPRRGRRTRRPARFGASCRTSEAPNRLLPAFNVMLVTNLWCFAVHSEVATPGEKSSDLVLGPLRSKRTGAEMLLFHLKLHCCATSQY